MHFNFVSNPYKHFFEISRTWIDCHTVIQYKWNSFQASIVYCFSHLLPAVQLPICRFVSHAVPCTLVCSSVFLSLPSPWLLQITEDDCSTTMLIIIVLLFPLFSLADEWLHRSHHPDHGDSVHNSQYVHGRSTYGSRHSDYVLYHRHWAK